MKLSIVFSTLLTIICLSGLTSATSAVTIQNNKYENIVIAISPFVPQDPTLIDKIKVFLHSNPAGLDYTGRKILAYERIISNWQLAR